MSGPDPGDAAEHSKARCTPRRLAAAAGIAALVCIPIACTIRDYGATWDEVLYLEEGTTYVAWLRGPSFGAIDESWRSTHPPLHRILGGVSREILHDGLGLLDELTAFRFATLAFVFVLAFALFLVAQELFGTAVALAVIVMFFGMPRVFFHSHLGALDVSVASAVFCACIAYVKSFEEPSWVFAAAALLGVAVSMKLNAAIAVVPMGLLLATHLAMARDEASRARMLLYQLPMILIPPLVFFAVWPWLWPDPFPRAMHLYRYHAQHFPIATYYLGRVFSEAPFHYPFVMTALTIPLPTLALAGVGIVGLRRPRRRLTLAFFFAAALTPLFVIALPGVPKSGGVRHFIIGYPFLCLVAGTGLREILDCLRTPRARFWTLGFVWIAIVASSLPPIVRLHPYQIAYFNPIIGGVRGAFRRGFDLDYWGGSYRGLVDWMNRHPERVYWIPLAPRLGEFYRETGVLDPEIRFGTREASDTLVLLNRPSFFDREMWRCLRSDQPLGVAGPPGVDLARLCDRSR